MYNILIIGHGYVGQAVSSIFENDSVSIIDPKYNNNTIHNFSQEQFDLVFVCVDTPKNENFKVLDLVLSEADKNLQKGTIVVCKSTATPNFYSLAEKKYKNIKILHCPEYLSHWNNISDFKHQEFIIIGGDKDASRKTSRVLQSRLKYVKNVRITDIKTAALVKYSENAFLALKVTFANELFNTHKALGCKSDFKDFTEMLGLDSRIGKSHFQVPGRDGKYGWGGHCFEKDNYEFEKFSKSSLIKFMINLNKKHRLDE